MYAIYSLKVDNTDIDRDIIDESQFSALYQQLSLKIYRIALLYIKDENLAQDILQEVFLMLWKNRKNKHLIEPLESYLFQCTRNKAIDSEVKKHQKPILKYCVILIPISQIALNAWYQVAFLKNTYKI